jgi:hypothetical protein
MAEAWSRRAAELVEAVGKPYDVAYVLQRVASYRLWMARWQEAEAGFSRDVEIARQVGDQRLLGDGMCCLVLASIYQGRFLRAEALFTEMMEWVYRTEDSSSAAAASSAPASSSASARTRRRSR